MSFLVIANPQAFLDLLFPGTYHVQHHRTKLKSTQGQPDAVLEALRHGQRFITNIEFQAASDAKMAQRLLLYAILIWSEHHLAISSFVIYLFQDHAIQASPFSMITPGNIQGDFEERIRFHYTCLKMWELQPETILRLGHAVLYPFLPLTKGGATRLMVDQMFTLLNAEKHRELALIGFSLASGIFSKRKQYDDLEWLGRKHQAMHDIIRDTPFYAWITEDARAEGRTEGRIEGLSEGRLEERTKTVALLRDLALEIIQDNFPMLLLIAKTHLNTIDSPLQLRQLIPKLHKAHTEEQAYQALFSFLAEEQ